MNFLEVENMCRIVSPLVYLTITSCIFSHLFPLIPIMQAGKGRTGLMVCAYLAYCGMSADEALQLYADRRTTNNEGVSYIRYNSNNLKCRFIFRNS